jgi:hypothetical protein
MRKNEVKVPESVEFEPSLHAIKKETIPVKVDFDVDEIAKLKAEHFDTSRQLAMKEDEKKEFVDKINADIKGLKETAKSLMSMVRKEYNEENKEVYLVPDQDLGLMLYVTAERKVVSSRRLRPDERQESVIHLAGKTGTDNK